MTVKPGDKVITDKYAGSNVKIGDEEFTIVRLNDILAIVDCSDGLKSVPLPPPWDRAAEAVFRKFSF